MSGPSRIHRASRLMQAMAGLPGGQCINITARSYPRFGPCEPGTMYHEQTAVYPVDHLPETLDVPADAEEIRISLLGELQREQSVDLVGQLLSRVPATGIDPDWEVRAELLATTADSQPYHVDVIVM